MPTFYKLYQQNWFALFFLIHWLCFAIVVQLYDDGVGGDGGGGGGVASDC